MNTPRELTKYMRRKNSLIRSFTNDEKNQFLTVQKQLRSDTDNDLSETEYEQLTVMVMFLHKYDAWFKDKDVDKVSTDIQTVARLYRERVIQEMRKYREKGGKQDTFLQGAKEIILEMESEDGGELKFSYKKPKIIDLTNLTPPNDEE